MAVQGLARLYAFLKHFKAPSGFLSIFGLYLLACQGSGKFLIVSFMIFT
jgi:hypothetical protein